MSEQKLKRGQKGSGIKARQFNPSQAAYMRWLATPTEFHADNEAKNISEYAKMHKVDRGTLYNWTQKPGFWDEVQALYEKQYAYKNIRVDQALYQKAIGQPCGSVVTRRGMSEGKPIDVTTTTKETQAPDTGAIELWKAIHDKYVKKLELKGKSILEIVHEAATTASKEEGE